MLNSQHCDTLCNPPIPAVTSTSVFVQTDNNGLCDFPLLHLLIVCFSLIYLKLLGQLENTGPPPAEKEMISSLPTVCISEEQTGSDTSHRNTSSNIFLIIFTLSFVPYLSFLPLLPSFLPLPFYFLSLNPFFNVSTSFASLVFLLLLLPC